MGWNVEEGDARSGTRGGHDLLSRDLLPEKWSLSARFTA
jgi:hypothetical protein